MTDRDEMVRALLGDPAPRPLWPFMLLAAPIAAIWALVGIPDGLPPWDGTEAGRVGQIAYILGGSIIPAVVTWVPFHFFFFSKRASFPTSLTMLGIMALCAAALPITVLFLVNR